MFRRLHVQFRTPYRLVGQVVCASVMILGWGTAAKATVLLDYINTAASCYQVGPCTQAAGVSGSNLATLAGNGYSGYDNLPWSDAGLNGPLQLFDFSMTASASGDVTNFSLDAFNNDCEIGGFVFCDSPVDWTVQYAINGGPFTPFLTFNSGTPYVTYPESAPLSLAFNAGDTVDFQMYSTDTAVVYTGQYVFNNIELDGNVATPEPGSLLLFGTGLAGIVGTMRRKFAK
jgi:hypothetical protein